MKPASHGTSVSAAHVPPFGAPAADRLELRTGHDQLESSQSAPSPLAVALVWLTIVLAGRAWPGLVPLAEPLGTAGQVVLVTLAVHAAHEAGHLLAGWLVGVPFSRVTLAMFTVSREEHPTGAQFRWVWNRAWHKAAGCVERDVTPGPGLRGPLTVTAMGGPLASILFGALLWPCGDPWRGLGLVSVLVGILNAIPIASFGQLSDGMLVMRLWSRDPAHVAWRAALCEPGATQDH